MDASNARRHLVLIGLMGAGKSSVGASCAVELDRPLVDTDEAVVAASGRTIPELFDAIGERGFRALERQAVDDTARSSIPLVIACGGGVVLDGENRRVLRANGLVVWLDASPEVLARRVDGTGRPLLAGAPVLRRLEQLAAERAAAYKAAAHVRVDAEGSLEVVTSRVLDVWSRPCSG